MRARSAELRSDRAQELKTLDGPAYLLASSSITVLASGSACAPSVVDNSETRERVVLQDLCVWQPSASPSTQPFAFSLCCDLAARVARGSEHRHSAAAALHPLGSLTLTSSGRAPRAALSTVHLHHYDYLCGARAALGDHGRDETSERGLL